MNQAQTNEPNDVKDLNDTIDVEQTVAEVETIDNAEAETVEAEPVVELSETQILEAKITELESQVKEAKEGLARANAESYNAQRRMEQETDKAKKFALQKFAKELLDVVDNLERATISVQNDDNADDAIMEGIKLTHKSLLTTLNKNGVEAVDPIGEKFNPDFHEAVGIFPDAEPDHVGVVFQKGYTLNGRSIRPAMVQVGA